MCALCVQGIGVLRCWAPAGAGCVEKEEEEEEEGGQRFHRRRQEMDERHGVADLRRFVSKLELDTLRKRNDLLEVENQRLVGLVQMYGQGIDLQKDGSEAAPGKRKKTWDVGYVSFFMHTLMLVIKGLP